MPAKVGGSPAKHFGRQMRKARQAAGMTLREFCARTGVNYTSASLVENGHRPPTERLAQACDSVFSGWRGWFSEYYEDSKSWVPAGFRSWSEYEDRAKTIHAWSPGIVHGLLQSADYARALIDVEPDSTEEIACARLASRMDRQRRVLLRDDPPRSWLIVDELSLYRRVGSAEVMTGQLRHLVGVAALPHVTLTVMPAVEHPGNASGFVVTEEAAYAEHAAGGFTYTDEEKVYALGLRFDTLRAESYRASESLALLERVTKIWAAGASPLTPEATAGTA